jgi:peptidoglycan/xylan/chitin deacetylase (PgdA/CDA1 family)
VRRRKRLLAAAVGAGALLLAVVAWQPPWAYRLLARAFPDILWHVEGAGPRIALTFDDGPSPEHTPKVLDILARHHARATFFLIGPRAAAHPEIVRRMRAEGHEIANHYSSKRSTLFVDEGEFMAEVARAEAMMAPVGPPKLFRPPGGVTTPANRRALERSGYRCVLGTAYPFDGNGPPAGYIRWVVVKNLRPGTIVILHDGVRDPANTITSLDAILDAARDKGLEVVPVGELLAARSARDAMAARIEALLDDLAGGAAAPHRR